jgi:DNA-binding protein YbaB
MSAINVTVNGKHEVKSIKIDPEVLADCNGDPEMLEDLLTVALNEAISTAIKTSDDEMGAITGGLNIPGMNGLF